MATIKSYTSVEQSKALAEILPLESADMWFANGIVVAKDSVDGPDDIKSVIPCWSLAALLDVLPYPILYQQSDGTWALDVWVEQVKPYFVTNAICRIDACYEMILKLHELNLL